MSFIETRIPVGVSIGATIEVTSPPASPRGDGKVVHWDLQPTYTFRVAQRIDDEVQSVFEKEMGGEYSDDRPSFSRHVINSNTVITCTVSLPEEEKTTRVNGAVLLDALKRAEEKTGNWAASYSLNLVLDPISQRDEQTDADLAGYTFNVTARADSETRCQTLTRRLCCRRWKSILPTPKKVEL